MHAGLHWKLFCWSITITYVQLQSTTIYAILKALAYTLHLQIYNKKLINSLYRCNDY